MNKKFIWVSLIICIPLVLLIGFFSMTIKSVNDEVEPPQEKLIIEYKDYKEDENFGVITIIVKNKSKDIVSINDLELSFQYTGDYEGQWTSESGVYIKGYEEDTFDEERIHGIDPGQEKEVIFKIPKAVTFDKEKYKLDKPIIDYNVSFYKFRKSKNSLILGVGSIGGSKTIKIKY